MAEKLGMVNCYNDSEDQCERPQRMTPAGL